MYACSSEKFLVWHTGAVVGTGSGYIDIVTTAEVAPSEQMLVMREACTRSLHCVQHSIVVTLLMFYNRCLVSRP